MPAQGLPGSIARKQKQFFSLKGTSFQLDSLQPTPSGFLKVFPQAAANTFVRPFPWETKGLLQLLSSAETIIFWLVICLAVWQRDEQWRLRISNPVIVFMLCLSVSVYLFIGYIVPFPGAIVRYKAIPELLILCCMIAVSRWELNKL
jgi:hypothetical protein